jgi:hypothetical protein
MVIDKDHEEMMAVVPRDAGSLALSSPREMG